MALANQIANQSALALKWAKKAINISQETNLSVGLGYEALAEALLFSSQDRQEGINAFFEKRKPKFKGV
jgi:enoyl-CoA hydratase